MMIAGEYVFGQWLLPEELCWLCGMWETGDSAN